jgi:hypothetical protein
MSGTTPQRIAQEDEMATAKAQTPEVAAAIALLTGKGYAVLTSDESGILNEVRNIIDEDFLFDGPYKGAKDKRAYKAVWDKLEDSGGFGR